MDVFKLPRVAIVRADSYVPADIEQAINSSLELIGGLEKFVRPGMRVLLKPNLLSAKGPDRAITTHPEFVAAVARMVRSMGGRVTIGDSPAGAKTGIQRVWDNTGLAEVARRDGLNLVSFESSGTSPVAVNTRTYYIAKPVLEADLVINLPKLKTHVLTLMTGAVKNMFGVIPGFRKGLYHKEAPNPRHFARIVVDIFSAVQPSLTIMDAVWGMEGDGPASGSPRALDMVLASEDGVALDTVMATIIGLDPRKVQTIRYASEAGLGIGWIEGIIVVGEELESVQIPDFKLTSNLSLELMPKFLMDMVGPMIWMRPQIDPLACIQCGLCVKSCPVHALSQTDTNEVPQLNQKLCINCWCCHEICPVKAVQIEKSWLASKVLR
jgi:uncharacterized protein (DUF362 family)/Pyruvate/2-oxoacid:ferredoxin oxidoreductase delta subunit